MAVDAIKNLIISNYASLKSDFTLLVFLKWFIPLVAGAIIVGIIKKYLFGNSHKLLIKLIKENNTKFYEKLNEEIAERKIFHKELIAKIEGNKSIDAEREKIIHLSNNTKAAFKVWEDAHKRLGSIEFVKLLISEAEILIDAGQYREALDSAEMAFKILPKDIGVVSVLSKALWKVGEFKTAVYKLTEVLELAKDKEEESYVLNNLGLLLYYIGSLDESEKYLRESLELKKSLYNENSIEVARNKSNLAHTLNAKHMKNEAGNLYSEALEAVKKTYPNNNHPIVSEHLNNLGSFLSDKDQVKAEECYRAAIEIYNSYYDYSHPELATFLANLGSVLTSQGRLAEAEEKYIEAIEIEKNAFNMKHPHQIITLAGYARLLYMKEDYINAEIYYNKALELLTDNFGSGHYHETILLLELIDVLIAQDKYEETEILLQNAINDNVKVSEQDYINLADVMYKYSIILVRMRDLDKAKNVTRNEIEIRINYQGVEHNSTKDSIERLEILDSVNY